VEHCCLRAEEAESAGFIRNLDAIGYRVAAAKHLEDDKIRSCH
jgi:hypothetical protein